MGEQAKTIEYRVGTARPHEARSMTRRGHEVALTNCHSVIIHKISQSCTKHLEYIDK